MRKSLPGLMALIGLALLAFAGNAIADPPLIINHQARLLDSNDQPVNGTVNIIYSLWDDSTAGRQLWTETQDVVVRNGLLNVRLGQFYPPDPGIFSLPAVQLWLQIQVSGDLPLSPRLRLGSVPFALDTRSLTGDVQTGPGRLFIIDPGSNNDGIELNNAGDPSTMTFTNEGRDRLRLGSSPGGASHLFLWNAHGDLGAALNADDNGSHLHLTDSFFDIFTELSFDANDSLANFSLMARNQRGSSSNKSDNASPEFAQSFWNFKPSVNDCTQVDIKTDAIGSGMNLKSSFFDIFTELNMSSSNNAAVSRWHYSPSVNDCTQVDIKTDAAGSSARLSSFFDIFTEIDLTATNDAAQSTWLRTPAVDDCTMVVIKSDGIAAGSKMRSSFFDIFTEISATASHDNALSLMSAGHRGGSSSNKIDNASDQMANSIWKFKPSVNDCTQVDMKTDAFGSSSSLKSSFFDIFTEMSLNSNDSSAQSLMTARQPNGPSAHKTDNTTPVSAQSIWSVLNPAPQDCSWVEIITDIDQSKVAIFSPNSRTNPGGNAGISSGRTGSNLWMEDSFFDITYRIDMSTNSNGSTLEFGSSPGPPNIQMLSNGAGSSLVMVQPGPPDNSIMLKSVSGAGSIGIFDAAYPPNPFVEMSHDATGSSLVMQNPGPPQSPMIQLNTNANGRGVIAIERTNSGFPPSPFITLANDGTGSSLVMSSPGPPESPSLNMNVSANGGMISFASPSGATMMNLNSGGGGFFMGNLGFGTSSAPNILTVVQRSLTLPIADAWTTYSSRRWKKNIQTLDGALDKVLRLRGVSYDWKADNKHDIGLIAEEVGQIVPEVVTYEDNGVDAKSVDYARLTALLIEAVKEQQKTINELKSEVGELKAQSQKQASINTGR